MTEIKKRFEELRKKLSIDGAWIFAGTLLQRAARLWPQKTAIICGKESTTFQHLYQEACVVTQRLQNLKIQPGDRVIILYENSINFYRAYYGAWQTGAIVAPLNVFLHEREIEHIIQDSQPAAIITSKMQKKKLEKLSVSVPVLSDELFERQDKDLVDVTIPARGQDECAALLYTSGTTGLPKGVMLSSKNILTNSAQGIANFAVGTHERVYAALPLFHSYMQNTAVWSTFILGATAIIVPSISRSALLEGLAQKPTVVLGIPQLYGLFCLMKTAPLSSVKLFISGGDALHNKIRMCFELIYQRKLSNGYGLTEASPFIAVDLYDHRKPTGCVGQPMEGISVEIRDSETQTVCPTGIAGLLWIKGDNVMIGYYNAPETTKKVLVNRWLNTGDLAYLDDEGFIVLCGREKDLIIHKGFNVYPQEIENILTSHPSVMMAAVVAKQHDDEEIPVAFVALKEQAVNENAVIEELKTLCEHNLARYKIPHQFFVRRELPTTATGKIDKKSLRKALEDMRM